MRVTTLSQIRSEPDVPQETADALVEYSADLAAHGVDSSVARATFARYERLPEFRELAEESQRLERLFNKPTAVVSPRVLVPAPVSSGLDYWSMLKPAAYAMGLLLVGSISAFVSNYWNAAAPAGNPTITQTSARKELPGEGDPKREGEQALPTASMDEFFLKDWFRTVGGETGSGRRIGDDRAVLAQSTPLESGALRARLDALRAQGETAQQLVLLWSRLEGAAAGSDNAVVVQLRDQARQSVGAIYGDEAVTALHTITWDTRSSSEIADVVADPRLSQSAGGPALLTTLLLSVANDPSAEEEQRANAWKGLVQLRKALRPRAYDSSADVPADAKAEDKAE